MENPNTENQGNKYTVKIALVVLALLIFAGAYIGYSTYKNSPEWKAQQMLKAQEELLAEIAKDQAQMAEEAKKLIEEMEKKKKEQEKIYQAYLSGAKMDQAELNRIQDRLKNLEYCEAMMSYECFTNSTASGAPVSSAPSHRYSLITTAYAHDTSDTIYPRKSYNHSLDVPKTGQISTNSDNNNTVSAQKSSRTTQTSATTNRYTQSPSPMNQLHTLKASTTGGQETPEERTERKIQ